jgi:hypothetical protein
MAGHIPSGLVFDPSVSALDILTTVAAAAGVSLPNDRVYDGVNLVPILNGSGTMPDRTLCWRWFGLGPTGPPGSLDTIWAVRKGDLKLVVERAADESPPALYDVETDCGETENLAVIQPDDAASLQALYDQWNANMIAPQWPSQSVFLTGYADRLELAGDWNGFNFSDNMIPWALTREPAPTPDGNPDGFNWWKTTIHVAAAGGDTVPGTHSFVLVGGSSCSNQWAAVPVNIDAVTIGQFASGTTLGANSTISCDDGYYYNFRIVEPPVSSNENLTYAVLRTSVPPVTVSCSGRDPIAPTSSDPVKVNIILSQATCPEEKIYVRWSTDDSLHRI